MTAKPVVLREAATRDVDNALAYHLADGDEQAALHFLDELERALGHVGRYPESGSPRYGHELAIPGLRSWPFHSAPHLVFYRERQDHVDVWRILHGHRDVPVSLRDSE